MLTFRIIDGSHFALLLLSFFLRFLIEIFGHFGTSVRRLNGKTKSPHHKTNCIQRRLILLDMPKNTDRWRCIAAANETSHVPEVVTTISRSFPSSPVVVLLSTNLHRPRIPPRSIDRSSLGVEMFTDLILLVVGIRFHLLEMLR